jgi:hypothetical protein
MFQKGGTIKIFKNIFSKADLTQKSFINTLYITILPKIKFCLHVWTTSMSSKRILL